MLNGGEFLPAPFSARALRPAATPSGAESRTPLRYPYCVQGRKEGRGGRGNVTPFSRSRHAACRSIGQHRRRVAHGAVEARGEWTVVPVRSLPRV